MQKATFLVSLVTVAAMLLFATSAAFAAPASVKKSVQKLEDGNYLIKFVVMAERGELYAFELKDPQGSIIDVYAPKSWCMLTDGSACHSRTDSAPINAQRSLEFIVHATSPDAKFVWTFFDRVKQIGASEVL